ncbi:3-deoxy-D-manno-octulosonate 8-phosphate phosphatase (KDO 8-P phosphatase) [Orenia metallireducens]|uniref:3-deoxy-D-manno-octulosonate 8-phosphate phosphatase (KDO 8-P phosphatase) n=1 Tax=Orenia metallireducens TaxID=1413210 RepID=A0A285GLQ9_9FIRM|nr:3-deoxy-D-manno-octulosonate 8-phosphate phosphatase (KDO 8-P phosphatase) [Orenia metallireducens]SNY24368.1 3-deoxy-D-manno-octulosonate 8-phosphate phosphatase (KDO 8-P phosphatase) [Orenia metallireducens]
MVRVDSVLKEKANKVKLFITDVDGVLTDGRIILGNNGEELKFFHVHDGKGIQLAHEAGIKTAIITGRESKLVERRAEELSIKEVHQNIKDKIKVFNNVLDKYNVIEEEVAYIGDDVNDLDILERVGLSFTPANGVKKVKEVVDYITTKEGGQGAVREAIELILEYQDE